jgi:signal transduction histidine kinase
MGTTEVSGAPGTLKRPIRWGRPATALVVIGGVAYVLAMILTAVYGQVADSGGPLFSVIIGVAIVAWGGTGWLIGTRRPENPISLVMCGEAFLVSVVTGISYIEQRWPDAWVSAWFSNLQGYVVLLLLAVPLVLLLFPSGYPPSRRWNGVLWLMAISSATGFAGMGLAPTDPIAWSPIATLLTQIAALTGVVAEFLAIAAVIVRFRRSRGDERAQMRWLALVALVGGALFVSLLIGSFFDPNGTSFAMNVLWALLLLTITIGLPIAVGVAVLRYRLYDIDVVIKKTLVAVVLALLLALTGLSAIAVAGQIAIGKETPRSAAVAIGVGLGVLVMPLLRLSRRIANRIVYGRRATPYEVLASFSGRVSETYTSDDVLPRMAQLLLAGSGAASARVLVRVGTELQEAASAGVPESAEHVEPIGFQGEEVGALAVSFPANDPIDAQRTQLIEQLATQAGPVVRNVRLLEELRASRQRLVAAQDEERRKIERNLHDGVQQQLVALNVQLGLLARVAEREPTKAGDMATGLQTLATTALEDLRDLARGIYPPLLADKGLAAALEAQARKAAVLTSVESDGIGRYGRDVEAAIYFCVLEALNNVAKYANATSATVRLAHEDGLLSFSVADDGEGFDATTRRYGTGLQGMADRLDAIGGSLAVQSDRGSGTTVTGIVPV